ncbi:MAG: FHA domain-containing protein [Actinomycetota bacterium]
MRPIVEVRERGRTPLRVEVGDRLDIGRECDGLLLTDARVSRRHLRLEVVEDRLRAIDLGSSNGTYLDGRRLNGPTEFGDDQVLVLGSTSVRVVGATARPSDEIDLRASGGDSAATRPTTTSHPGGDDGPSPTPRSGQGGAGGGDTGGGRSEPERVGRRAHL